MYRFFSVLILTILLTNISLAQPKKKKSKKTKPIEIQQVTNQESLDSFQVLASGKVSKIDKSFILVARDKETYQILQNWVEKLPNVDFSKNAVVGIFAELPNPCHTFSVNKNADKISVNFVSPETRVVCIQVVSFEFKVVLIPIEDDKPLQLELPKNWLGEIKNYQVTNSKFNYSGGFAGISEDFQIEGNIGVMQFGEYVTFLFNLKGTGENKFKILNETASGTSKNGEVNLKRLDAGTFADNPKPPMKISGKLDKILSLKFVPLPTNVADGFAVSGMLEANLK